MTHASVGGVQPSADQLMRRTLHLVSKLSALAVSSESALVEMQNRRKTEVAQAERASRQEVETAVDRSAPGLKDQVSLGSRHRQTLSSARYGTIGPHPDSGPPPDTYHSLIRDWSALSADANRLADGFYQQHLEWQNKPGWRRGAPPALDTQHPLWQKLERLDLLHRSFPGLKQAHIAAQVRSASGPIDLALKELLDRQREEQSRLVDELRLAVTAIESEVTLPSAPWADSLWDSPVIADSVGRLIRLGELQSSGALELPAIPALIPFPFDAGMTIGWDSPGRDEATGLVRSLMLRLLALVPPGGVQFKVIDPVAIGQSVAEFRQLAEYDAQLVDEKTWTSERDIERILEDLTDHLEVVISTYLRGQFESIDEFNQHAGEVAEPYRVVVVFDFPHGFSDRAANSLLSLIENGPRCGVFTILHVDRDRVAAPQGHAVESRVVQTGQQVQFTNGSVRLTLPNPVGNVPMNLLPDIAPPLVFDREGRPATGYSRLLALIGETARERKARPAAVTLESLLPVLARSRSGVTPEYLAEAQAIGMEPSSWWGATTADRAVAVLGRTGAQGVTSAWFSSTEVAGGAIIVGLPRSGKTTALHSMILSMAMLYSPEELELYLIDAKHGVEFAVYATLPHARMVSVHSEREFSLAVLQSLVSEIGRRAELMKAAGQVNLPGYRRATGEALTRVVVVLDEFHELFKEADAAGQDAFAAFSSIVKQGSSFGVHLVVASQTLSSMPAMDRQTLTLLPQRVAFQCNDYDAEIVMGDTNKGARALSAAGAGLFNPARGDEARNQPFQGLYVSEDDRPVKVAQLAQRASQAGWDRRPRVFDGHSTVARPPAAEFAATDGNHLWIPLGEPFSLARRELLAVRRTRGANLLLLHGGEVGDSSFDPLEVHAAQPQVDQAMRGALHSIIEAGCLQGVDVTVVDFDPGANLGSALPIREIAGQFGAEYVRSGSLGVVLASLAAMSEERTAAQDYDAALKLLILCGLDRASTLVPHDPYGTDDGLPTAGALLAALIQHGPDVGMHTVVWADRAASVNERLGNEMLRDFAFRVAGSGTDRDDVGIVLPTYGTVPTLERGQLFVGDHFARKAKRIRGYASITTKPTDQEEPNV